MSLNKHTIARIFILMSFLATTLHLNAEDRVTNLEIVRSTYEGKNSEENAKSLQRSLAPNVQWTEAAGFPYAGTYIGWNEINKNVFDRLGSEWIEYRFEIERFIAQNDEVIAYGTYYGTYKETGKSFEARVAHLWRLKKGKIISFEQFVDSVPVVNATTK